MINGTGTNGGILGHYVSGTVGSFASGSKWLGLGVGNPGNIPEPYGLAILDSANLGFYNIIAESGRKNVIAGFGVNGTNNKNRFIIRGYSGTNGATGKDLLVANPEGGVGINAEPLSSLWVDSRFSNPDSLFRAIAILSRQPLFSASSVETASAIGTQANNSLISDEIAVEGFRAQIPDFISVLQNPEGVAVNLQTVNNPRGDANTPTVTDVVAFGNTEYAELTWQDIDSDDNVYVSCDSFPIDSAEIRDKFFISFRSGENVKPFVAGNKLPVMTFQANGRVGIGTLQPTSGTCGIDGKTVLLDVNGLINAFGVQTVSDRRFKQEVEPVQNSLALIRQLRGTTYTFNKKAFPARHFPGGKQYGFIAQELEKVIPEATMLNSDGYYAVNYTMLIPVLTEAIKEQDSVVTTQASVISAQASEIARLNAEMQELRNAVLALQSGSQTTPSTGFRLEQNTPNPFGNTTQIRYAMPANTTGASINVYDLNGRLVQSFILSAPEGLVTINAADFPSGIYIYDLLVNGRQMDVKRMVLSKS